MKYLFAIPFLLLCVMIHAQTTAQRDPQIEKMVSQVSKDSLQSYIKKPRKFWYKEYVKYAI